jgi:hypothetical protein
MPNYSRIVGNYCLEGVGTPEFCEFDCSGLQRWLRIPDLTDPDPTLLSVIVDKYNFVHSITDKKLSSSQIKSIGDQREKIAYKRLSNKNLIKLVRR